MALSHGAIKADIEAVQNASDKDTAADLLATAIENAVKSLSATGTTAQACTAGGAAGTCTITSVT